MNIILLKSRVRTRMSVSAMYAPALIFFLLATVTPRAVHAQGKSQSEAVRDLNNQVLNLHAQLQHATGPEAAALRAQAAPIIQQRSSALSALIQQSRPQALGLAFSPDLAAKLATAFPASASQFESHGIWQGPIEYYISDDAARKSSRSIIRMMVAQEKLTIHLDGIEPPGLMKCGSVLNVQGIRLGTDVAAAGATIQGTSSVAAQGTLAAAGACSTTGVQNVAVLLVTFPGIPAPSLTTQSVNDIFFGQSGRSLDGFWKEASYNTTSATGSVFGWYTLDQVYTCDQTDLMLMAAVSAAGPYVDFSQYNRVAIVFPDSGACWFAGLSTLGCTSFSSGNGMISAGVSWLVAGVLATSRDYGVMLATHELGHTLGLHHASSRDFGTEALGPLGATGTLNEYGDFFSTMGAWNLGHYGAPHKALLGWMQPGVNYQVVQSSGTFTLHPLETSGSGLQALKVQRGAGNDDWLWIEYRQPTGSYDSSFAPQLLSGALIHYEDSITGPYTHLLDFTPETDTWSDPDLVPTRTWTDPYTNLSLSATNATSGSLTVQVSYGGTPPACLSGVPTVIVSPLNPSVVAGGAVNYTVSITNNDSVSCASSTFDFRVALPSGWSSSFTPTTVTLAPGQSVSTSMTETVLAGTTPGTYAISISAADLTSTGTATANTSVIAAPPTCTAGAPSVALSPVAQNVIAGSSVNYTVTVMDNDSSACSSSTFNLLSALPSGWSASFTPTSLTLAPGQSGSAMMTEMVPAGVTPGTYSIRASAANGTSSATATASSSVLAPPSTCTAGAPSVALSPVAQNVIAGSSVNYTVTVINNDSFGCSLSTFNLSPAVPRGWVSALTPTSLTLSPGQSASATLTEIVPAGTTPGTYLITVAAADTFFSATATASCSVNAPPPPPAAIAVSLSVPKSTYTVTSKAVVPITAAVLSGTTPLPGASVSFTVIRPNGSRDVFASTTSASGQAVWNFSIKNHDPVGVYSVTAQAMFGSQTSMSNPVTFLVQ